jgi:hypothetical protein
MVEVKEGVKQKMIEDMTIQELKCLHYDVMVEVEQRQQVISLINQRIQKLQEKK